MRIRLALAEAGKAEIKAKQSAPERAGQHSVEAYEAGTQGEEVMTDAPQAGSNSNARLKSIVERIETLEASKQEIAADIKDIYTESHGNGFDVKALRTIIRLRKQSPDDRAAQEAVLDTYKHALGMA
jgi:uncharacterized protein (UPF0335 family)